MGKLKKDIIEKIYEYQIEEITYNIDRKWRNTSKKNKKDIENIKLCFYTQESYKQGFLDGMNMMIKYLEKQ